VFGILLGDFQVFQNDLCLKIGLDQHVPQQFGFFPRGRPSATQNRILSKTLTTVAVPQKKVLIREELKTIPDKLDHLQGVTGGYQCLSPARKMVRALFQGGDHLFPNSKGYLKVFPLAAGKQKGGGIKADPPQSGEFQKIPSVKFCGHPSCQSKFTATRPETSDRLSIFIISWTSPSNSKCILSLFSS